MTEVTKPDICQFVRGERDCREHKEADKNGSPDYQKGFNFQYGLDEMKSKGYIK